MTLKRDSSGGFSAGHSMPGSNESNLGFLWDDQLEHLLERFRTAGEAHAVALEQYTRLEHGRKGVLAQAMRDAKDGGERTVAGQEREAECSLDYRTYIEGLAVARGEERRRLYDLELARWALQLFQTLSANERVERQGYRTRKS